MSELQALAEVNFGRWIAKCPRPGCPNAEHFGRDPESNHVGGLTGSGFRCGTAGHGCGLTCRPVWPPNVEDIERLLAMRPVPATRNWLPGETLTVLLAENLSHGILPASHEELVAGEDRALLEIVDDRIVHNTLAAGPRRAELGGG